MQSKPKVHLIHGDITEVDTEAIVNSGNETLLGDDGVDGAIHIAAGPGLRELCATLGGCRVAEVKVTPSFNLPHSYILHTVGPQFGNENGQEASLLAACYINCLKTADELKIKTLAFPSISTGQYGYPIEEGAEIALKTIKDYLHTTPTQIERVVMVLYPSSEFNDTNKNDFIVYSKIAKVLDIVD